MFTDLHNDALLKLPAAKLLPYLRNAKRNGVQEIWLSVWTTELTNPMTTIKQKKRILSRIAGNPDYPICRLHIEDAWFLTPENLTDLIALKPYSVGLTWNKANALAGGAFSRKGITKFGYTVIKELEDAGIQIDTAHLNRRSFWQFAKITTRPIVCTHTACNSVRHHRRNLTNRQIQAIIDSGGLVGICLVPQFLTKDTTYCGYYDLQKHILHFIKHFGRANLRLGTDFYGTEHLPYEIKNYADIQHWEHAQVIGYSVFKQPIIAYQFGNPNAKRRILITGGMHAREWVTCSVVRQLCNLCHDLPSDVCVALIPNCNPDGVRLATSGLTNFFPKRHQRWLIQINNGAVDFSFWKANARAVDLNVNYNLGWGQGASNTTYPAPANYIGRHPHSEPETRAILKFVKNFHPTVSLAFHSKGEVIYYSRMADRPTAEKLAQLSQYTPEFSVKSYGGLTDYLALKLNIPAFTIEVGSDSLRHPIGTQHLATIMKQITPVFYFFTGA